MKKIHIECKVCGTKDTRHWDPKRKQEQIICKTCNVKRKLEFLNDSEAIAVRPTTSEKEDKKIPEVVQQPEIKPKEEVKDPFSEQIVEPKKEEPKEEPKKKMPKQVFKIEQSDTKKTKQAVQQTYLEPHHVKALVALPFELAAMVTAYEDWKLTDLEKEDLGNNEAINRVMNKYFGEMIGKYPDEYVCLIVMGIVIGSKTSMYLKWKKMQEAVEYERRRETKAKERRLEGTGQPETGNIQPQAGSNEPERAFSQNLGRVESQGKGNPLR